MTTQRLQIRNISHSLLTCIAALFPLLAAAQVVRPDPSAVAGIEKGNETLSPAQAFENLKSKSGDWRIDGQTLTQNDPLAAYAQTFVEGPRWVDCVVKAKLRVDSTGPEAWNGARLIVRASDDEQVFYTVGLWAGGKEVRIEKFNGSNVGNVFQQIPADHFGKVASAPFPVEIGKTYEFTVAVDRANIYCFIDGKFAVMAQEADFTTNPYGKIGFFTNAATATFSDVSVKSLTGVTASPFKPHPANPLNITAYAPAVVKDDKYRLWDALGRYAESDDGITWDRPAGEGAVLNSSSTGDWPGGNNTGDPDVIKVDDEYWATLWCTTARRNGGFDGIGIKRSTDGINWTPELSNPVHYMGPYGDWDEAVVGDHALIQDGDLFKMWNVGINRWQRGYRNEFGYAESKDGLHWRKCRLNPILTTGEPGTWDSGWIYAAGVVKVDDEQTGSHNYAGKPGASYHLFYTGQPSNNEFIAAVKRIGYAFSLDGVNWVKWDDVNTTEPPFHKSDPVVTWSENYGDKGFLGVGAATAVQVGDEVRIYYSMYDDRPDTVRPEAVIGTGLATVKVDTLRKIVADAKAKGLLKTSTRAEIDALMDDPLPQSMWDDLQEQTVAAIRARAGKNKAAEAAALAAMTKMRGKFTKALDAYLTGPFAPLKTVLDALAAGKPVGEKILWSLPGDAARNLQAGANNQPQLEFTGLDIATRAGTVFIEFQATTNRYELARVAWATDGEFRPGDEREVMIGYPSAGELPTYRVPISTNGKTITGLRIAFPLNSEPDLQTLALREITAAP